VDDRPALVSAALRLEWLTIGWLAVEAGAALWAGISAGSLTVTAFGLDSLIEMASARVLIWRLAVELRHGQAFAEATERRASRIAGGLLFALAGYIVVASAYSLCQRQGAVFTPLGLAVALLAMPVMVLLSRRKRAVADALGSKALRADAVESLACAWLALVVVLGLLLDLALGAWWVDPVTALAVLWLVIKEAREAWSADECCESAPGS
jgi:divalent metal cation (Fe/Co/Zn/Cd) transporter